MERRRLRTEVAACVAFLLVAPLVGRLIVSVLGSPLRGLGLTQWVQSLDGSRPFTDIGWEVSWSAGLLDPVRTMYDPIATLAPLIGMSVYAQPSMTHPPTSVVMWIPLSLLPYSWWLGFFACASVLAVAVSLRLVGVPPWVAYPVTALGALTPIGMFAVTTTYPLAGLLIALAWRFRDHPWMAGPAYGLLAASRGFAGLMMVYPLIRRQWRTFGTAVAVIVVLGLGAIAIEPSSVAGFVDSATTLSSLEPREDNYAVDALLSRRGLPGWLAYVLAVAVFASGLCLRRERFWLLFWCSLCITPIAWAQSITVLLPLLAVMWMSGRWGTMLTVTALALTFGVSVTSPAGANASWLVVLACAGVGVLTCDLRPRAGRESADGVTGVLDPLGQIAAGTAADRG